METPKMPTPEEMAKMQASRTISDAKMLKDGANYSPADMRLNATQEQVESARQEMNADRDLKYDQSKEELRKKDEEVAALKEQLKKMQDKMAQITDVILGNAKKFSTLEEFDVAVMSLPESERTGLFIIPEELKNNAGGDVYFFGREDAEKYLEENGINIEKMKIKLPTQKEIDGIEKMSEEDFRFLFYNQGEYLGDNLQASDTPFLGELPEDVQEASQKAASVMRKEGEFGNRFSVILVESKGYYMVDELKRAKAIS